MDKRYQVFVSSTFTDLKEERKAIIETLLNAKYIPAGMEMFSASNNEQFKYIKKIIDTCDYYVLIVGARYGTINPTTGVSFTEQEYDYAVSKNIPVLAFLHTNPYDLPLEKRDDDKKELLEAFRSKVSKNRLCKMWNKVNELVPSVIISLTEETSINPQLGWTRGSSNDATQRSAVTETSVEQMKDTMMPYLDLHIKWDKFLLLSIRNTGPGLGKIRLVTVRHDITFESVFHPTNYWTQVQTPFQDPKGQMRINDFVLSSKEESAFQLEQSSLFCPTGDYIWLSSLSIYYEDVYGRVYRSRIVYTMDKPHNIKVISKENFSDTLPLNISSNFNVQDIFDLESQQPVVYRGEFLALHSLKFQKAIKNMPIAGTELTKERDLELLRIEFLWHGFPVFHIRVGGHAPFKLSYVNINGQATISISNLTGDKVSSYSEYGLYVDGDSKPLLIDLYYQIHKDIQLKINSYSTCDELLLRINPPKAENQQTVISNFANQITEVTRMDMFDYYNERYIRDMEEYIRDRPFGYEDNEKVFHYNGRKSEIEFLNRVYKLADMPSNDSRVENFEKDIFLHRVNNEDWPEYWIFEDERLGLNNGNDNTLLNFLCQTFHPIVRNEKSGWQSVLDVINGFLKVDGYEIYESEKISNKSVYSYRAISS